MLNNKWVYYFKQGGYYFYHSAGNIHTEYGPVHFAYISILVKSLNTNLVRSDVDMLSWIDRNYPNAFIDGDINITETSGDNMRLHCNTGHGETYDEKDHDKELDGKLTFTYQWYNIATGNSGENKLRLHNRLAFLEALNTWNRTGHHQWIYTEK